MHLKILNHTMVDIMIQIMNVGLISKMMNLKILKNGLSASNFNFHNLIMEKGLLINQPHLMKLLEREEDLPRNKKSIQIKTKTKSNDETFFENQSVISKSLLPIY